MKKLVKKTVLMPVEIQAWEDFDEEGKPTYKVCETRSASHADAQRAIDSENLLFDNNESAWNYLDNSENGMSK